MLRQRIYDAMWRLGDRLAARFGYYPDDVDPDPGPLPWEDQSEWVPVRAADLPLPKGSVVRLRSARHSAVAHAFTVLARVPTHLRRETGGDQVGLEVPGFTVLVDGTPYITALPAYALERLVEAESEGPDLGVVDSPEDDAITAPLPPPYAMREEKIRTTIASDAADRGDESGDPEDDLEDELADDLEDELADDLEDELADDLEDGRSQPRPLFALPPLPALEPDPDA